MRRFRSAGRPSAHARSITQRRGGDGRREGEDRDGRRDVADTGELDREGQLAEPLHGATVVRERIVNDSDQRPGLIDQSGATVAIAVRRIGDRQVEAEEPQMDVERVAGKGLEVRLDLMRMVVVRAVMVVMVMVVAAMLVALSIRMMAVGAIRIRMGVPEPGGQDATGQHDRRQEQVQDSFGSGDSKTRFRLERGPRA